MHFPKKQRTIRHSRLLVFCRESEIQHAKTSYIGASKGSTFGTTYNVLASLLSPSQQKISKFAEILVHQKGQLLAQCTMFWHLYYHPLGEKYPNLLKSWGIKRVNFWLSVRCFGIFTITLSAKNIQIC